MNSILNLTLLTTFLSGCCLIDYRPTIEKVAKPTLKELEAFYKTNKRFPNTKERDVMLEKAGCEMRGDICIFEGEELVISESGKTLSGGYDIGIDYMNQEKTDDVASCGFGIRSDYTVSPVICAKKACIRIKQ